MKSETLAKIGLALDRLEEGTYGDCAECGEPIPTPRLQALPFAVRCAPCEGAREKRMARRVERATRGYPHALIDA